MNILSIHKNKINVLVKSPTRRQLFLGFFDFNIKIQKDTKGFFSFHRLKYHLKQDNCP